MSDTELSPLSDMVSPVIGSRCSTRAAQFAGSGTSRAGSPRRAARDRESGEPHRDEDDQGRHRGEDVHQEHQVVRRGRRDHALGEQLLGGVVGVGRAREQRVELRVVGAPCASSVTCERSIAERTLSSSRRSTCAAVHLVVAASRMRAVFDDGVRQFGGPRAAGGGRLDDRRAPRVLAEFEHLFEVAARLAKARRGRPC